jgi:hypothetical protein
MDKDTMDKNTNVIELNESSDCLVFECFSEQNNKIFVLYDYYHKKYIIKGIKPLQDTFSFQCKNQDAIMSFIRTFFYHVDNVIILLHNYKQIPYEFNDIWVEYLNDISENNFYCGNTLNSFKLNFKENRTSNMLREQLNIIKNVYNKY